MELDEPSSTAERRSVPGVAVCKLPQCYRAYGLSICSTLALPFDPSLDARTADVTVHFGSVLAPFPLAPVA